MKVVGTDDGVGTAVGVKCNIKFETVYISLLYINYTAVCVKREEGSVLIVSIYVPCGINSGQLNKDLQTIVDGTWQRSTMRQCWEVTGMPITRCGSQEAWRTEQVWLWQGS